jgi:hypothetical protein
MIPMLALAAALMYQSTNAALYYLIGECVYFWAYSDGEVSTFVIVLESDTDEARWYVRGRGRCRNGRWRGQRCGTRALAWHNVSWHLSDIFAYSEAFGHNG